MIPEAAVEAGLYAWGFSSQNIDERRELLRHILEAAAPHLLAEAWEEGGRAAVGHYDTGYPTNNPYKKDEAGK